MFSTGAAIPASGTLTINSTSIRNRGIRPNSLPNVLVNGTNAITGNGNSGTGIATLNDSGTLTLFVSGGSDVFDLTGTMTGSGTLALGTSAMTLRFNGTGGDGNAIFNLGTGTAVASVRNNATGISLGGLAGGSGTVLYGASSDANTVIFTIGGANANTEFDGAIANGTYSGSPATAVTKIGAGSLLLTGTSTYSGSTTVSNGTLNITGTLTQSPVTMEPNTTLLGSGSLKGGLTVQAGGVISPGAGIGSAGTLTVSNNLTLNSPTLYFDLSSSPTSGNDQIAMQDGLLTITGRKTINSICSTARWATAPTF